MSIISRTIQDVHGLIDHASQERKEALRHLEVVLQTVRSIETDLGEKVQEVVQVTREAIDGSHKTAQKIEDAVHRCEMIVDAGVGLKQLSYVTDITHYFRGTPTKECVLQFEGKFSPPAGDKMVPFLELDGVKLDIIPRPSTSTRLIFTLPWKYITKADIQELPLILKIPRDTRNVIGWMMGRPVPDPFQYYPSIFSCPISIGEIRIESSTPPVIEEREISYGPIEMNQTRTDVTRVCPWTLRPSPGFQLIPQTISLKREIWRGKVSEERRKVDENGATYCVTAKGKSGHAKWGIVGMERGEITPRTPNPVETLSLQWGERIVRVLPQNHNPRITFIPFDGSGPESTNGEMRNQFITIVRNGDNLEIQAKQPHEVNIGGH